MSSNRPLDRRALFASATAAALLAAAGVTASSPPRRGGRLRMALSGASRSDNWASGHGLFMQVARQGLVFDTLTEVAADGTLRGELATGWDAGAKGQLWEFALRDDVTFHDGRPLVASDVVSSLALTIHGDVTAVDARHVRIRLDRPDPGLPLHLAKPDAVIAPGGDLTRGIGTGLYRVRHFAPGQQLLAERVADHYKGDTAGWFDEVELVSVPSATVRAEALGSYLVDAIDLQEHDLVAGLSDMTGQPDRHHMVQAVSREIGQPAQVGFQRPMDNLRAAERWWFI